MKIDFNKEGEKPATVISFANTGASLADLRLALATCMDNDPNFNNLGRIERAAAIRKAAAEERLRVAQIRVQVSGGSAFKRHVD